MGWRAYKTFPTSSLPVARHCYLFGGLFGQVGWSLGHNKDLDIPIELKALLLSNSFYLARVYYYAFRANNIS
jgi:hypothetical protein